MMAGPDALRACFVLPAFAPKGQQIIAQGFNPEYGVLIRCALKEAPECRVADCVIGSKIRRPDPTRRAPLSGRIIWTRNPGLKPWAKILRPCGAGPDRRLRLVGGLSARGPKGQQIIAQGFNPGSRSRTKRPESGARGHSPSTS
jgi:hypothetical protein